MNKDEINQKMHARAMLMRIAKRACIVLERDKNDWFHDMKKHSSELVSLIGDDEFRHLIEFVWRKNFFKK